MSKEGKHKEEIFAKTGTTIGVKDASFEVYESEIFVVMGLSGSGKSTLVRLLNRLIEPTSGEVFIDGENITTLNDVELVNTRRKKISMVFQSFALMPHMNILDNVSFGLELGEMPKAHRYSKARAALAQVELENYENSMPDELSGGMQQRVGLARALANDPDILLMDEAFSALDPLIRTNMQDQLLQLQEESKRTIIFISHDLDEAIRIGDRIAIMEGGEIAQIGTPDEIINNPANSYVRSFFQGVDVTSVLSASHIVRKIRPTIIQRDGFGIKSALRYISDYDENFAYYIKKDNTYIGLVTVESLKIQQAKNGNLIDAVVDQIPINENTQISNFMGDIANYNYPVAVVSDAGKYRGTISKSRLLNILDEGVSYGK